MKIEEEMDLFLELIQGLIEEEGYKVKQASEEGKLTTNYDYLIVESREPDTEYHISVGAFHPEAHERNRPKL